MNALGITFVKIYTFLFVLQYYSKCPIFTKGEKVRCVEGGYMSEI